MAENFYIVLGISRDADLGQIRGAYRRLVRQLHPDVSAGSPERFLEVQQAYEALSDPNTRQVHDDALQSGRRAPVPVRVHDRAHTASAPHVAPAGPFPAGMGDLFSAVDAFLGGFVPGMFATNRQASRHKDLYVEMILSRAEADTGGVYPLQVPVKQLCRECGGAGWRGSFYCAACYGGTLDYHRLDLSVPPRVRDGQRARVSLDDIGLPGVDLNVLVSVR